MDNGIICPVKRLDIVKAKRLIAMIKKDNFD